MSADPARIAKFSNDGIVISRVDDAIKAKYPNAEDFGTSEIEMFFRNQADADAMLDEKWNALKVANRVHEGVEITQDLGLGTTIQLSPVVPRLQTIDESRGIDASLAVRAFVQDMTTDRYSIELLQ